MGAEDLADVASYLGVDAGEANKRVARLLCAGGKNEACRISDYSGLDTCKAAASVAGGGKGCNWGCLGLADCEDSCALDAIYMNDNLLPVVIPELCTACNDCVDACPKDLFELMPIEQKLIVQCKNLLKGDAAEDLCSVACNTCNRCVADSEPGVIEMIDNLAVINYEKNELTDPKAISRCPTKAIVWVEGQQFVESSMSWRRKSYEPRSKTRPSTPEFLKPMMAAQQLSQWKPLPVRQPVLIRLHLPPKWVKAGPQLSPGAKRMSTAAT